MGVVTEAPEAAVAAGTQKGADALCSVAVVDVKRDAAGWGCAADGTALALSLKHGCELLKGEVVLATQPSPAIIERVFLDLGSPPLLVIRSACSRVEKWHGLVKDPFDGVDPAARSEVGDGYVRILLFLERSEDHQEAVVYEEAGGIMKDLRLRFGKRDDNRHYGWLPRALEYQMGGVLYHQ